MIALQLLPVVLSLIVLGAHFFRAGSWSMAAVVLVLLGMLRVRRAWVARLVQLTLVLGAAEWVRTLVAIADERMQTGHPVIRMSIILGAVALLTALSALVFHTARVRKRYGIGVARLAA